MLKGGCDAIKEGWEGKDGVVGWKLLLILFFLGFQSIIEEYANCFSKEHTESLDVVEFTYM